MAELALPGDTPSTTYTTKGAPTLKRFLQCDAPIQAIMGPFGSGKSVACVMKCLLLAQSIPPMPDGVRRSRFGVIRNTYPQLRDTTQKTLFEWLRTKTTGSRCSTYGVLWQITRCGNRMTN